MFDDKKDKESTMHRIYVEWPDGYFMTLGIHDRGFQEMIEDLGRPSNVEFRATDEGWVKE